MMRSVARFERSAASTASNQSIGKLNSSARGVEPRVAGLAIGSLLDEC
jgi:hypothetical protein